MMRLRSGYGGACLPLRVSYDEGGIQLWKEGAEGPPVLRTVVAWTSIVRICFKDNGPMRSDVVYVFARDRQGPLAIPLEAPGGGAFWRELRARRLYPADLHERATMAMDGGFYCWPPLARDGAGSTHGGAA